MEKLDDYKWLGSEWKIKEYIIEDISWEEILDGRLVHSKRRSLAKIEALNDNVTKK